MNALFQQLYHCRRLSDGLLRIESSLTSNSADDADKPTTDDSNERVLFNLQVLFAYLRMSQKKYYDTLPFCKEFRDYDGQPISLAEQKDINEFAGMLFDKLESNKEAATILADTIQGSIVYQTRSTETPYRSDREESFYMITAEVKNKPTLEESLDLFVADELFTGDNKLEDPVAGRKVEALRRCAIRKLPNTLIIHLKRFEFDLETLERRKVNDRFTFPTLESLNMFPYTEEGVASKEQRLKAGAAAASATDGAEDSLEGDETEVKDVAIEVNSVAGDDKAAPPPEQQARKHDPLHYQYELKGVVAHVGAIDRGHYYSFIKGNSQASSSGQIGNAAPWFEYNDRSVAPFAGESLAAECFGGEEQYITANGTTATRMKQNSAYLLFYERKKKVEPPSLPASKSMATLRPSQSLTCIESYALDASSAVGLSLDGDAETTTVTTTTTVDVKVRLPSPPPHEVTTEAESTLVNSHQKHTGTAEMSSKVLEAVWSENTEFQTDRYLFDATHFKFIWKLIHVRQLAGSSEDGDTEGVQNMMSMLLLVALKFVIEVAARARAKSCVMLFFERLEDLVLSNPSGALAEALLGELQQENDHSLTTLHSRSTGRLTDTSSPSIHNRKDRLSTGSRVGSPGAAFQHAQRELELLHQIIHPWLLQLYLMCPIPTTVHALSRFLFTCFKSLRATQSPNYLIRSDNPSTSSGEATDGIDPDTRLRRETMSLSSPLVPLEPAFITPVKPPCTSPSTSRPSSTRRKASVGQVSVKYIESSCYTNICTRFLNKVLLIVEKFPPDYVLGREGKTLPSRLLPYLPQAT